MYTHVHVHKIRLRCQVIKVLGLIVVVVGVSEIERGKLGSELLRQFYLLVFR